MVSKLLLATFEITKRAADKKEDKDLIGRLLYHYYEINEGIGVNKSPELYGAFLRMPIRIHPEEKGPAAWDDGTSKEDLLSRWGVRGSCERGCFDF